MSYESDFGQHANANDKPGIHWSAFCSLIIGMSSLLLTIIEIILFAESTGYRDLSLLFLGTFLCAVLAVGFTIQALYMAREDSQWKKSKRLALVGLALSLPASLVAALAVGLLLPPLLFFEIICFLVALIFKAIVLIIRKYGTRRSTISAHS